MNTDEKRAWKILLEEYVPETGKAWFEQRFRHFVELQHWYTNNAEAIVDAFISYIENGEGVTMIKKASVINQPQS
jgi:hypothetical protein